MTTGYSVWKRGVCGIAQEGFPFLFVTQAALSARERTQVCRENAKGSLAAPQGNLGGRGCEQIPGCHTIMSVRTGGDSGEAGAASTTADEFVPGLLALPASEERRAALAVRTTWAQVQPKIANHATIATRVHKAVFAQEGTTDEVLVDMVLRHLERCKTTEDLRLHELAHLLAILLGAAAATRLTKAVLGLLEEGLLEESWYERRMRRQYIANY